MKILNIFCVLLLLNFCEISCLIHVGEKPHLTQTKGMFKNMKWISNLGLSLTFLCSTVPVSYAVSLEQGQKLFEQSCNGCHAGGGNALPFASSKTLFKSDLQINGYNTKDKIVEIIDKGSIMKGMIPYGPISYKGNVMPGILTHEEMSSVADYVLYRAEKNWE